MGEARRRKQSNPEQYGKNPRKSAEDLEWEAYTRSAEHNVAAVDVCLSELAREIEPTRQALLHRIKTGSPDALTERMKKLTKVIMMLKQASGHLGCQTDPTHP